jgi:hypothetical protein
MDKQVLLELFKQSFFSLGRLGLIDEAFFDETLGKVACYKFGVRKIKII